MKVSQAVYYNLEYHKANSQPNTRRCVEFVLGKFFDQFQERVLASLSQEDVLSFLTKRTFNRRQTSCLMHCYYFSNFVAGKVRKQSTKQTRYL